MKNLNTLIALFVATALFGCAGNKGGSNKGDVPQSPPVSPGGSPASPAPTAAGTGDSGGGNLYRGKPLESYVQKVTDLPAYKNIVQRIVKEAIADIRFPMTYILEMKTWYFVPGPLSSLKPEQIGSVVPTEQAALQNFTQVWIDQDLFAKMTEADQAQLILHEVLMGFKLLKFESPRVGCSALKYGVWSGSQSECESLSNKKLGKISGLSALDYDDIRHTTSFLLTADLSKMASDGLEWRTVFNKGNFHFYTMYYVSKDQFVDSPFEKSLGEAKNSMENGYKLQFGYSIRDLDAKLPNWKRSEAVPDGLNWQSTLPCKVDLSLSKDVYDLKIQVGDYKIETSFQIRKEDESTALDLKSGNYFWANGEQFWQKDLTPFVSGNPPSQYSQNQRERLDRIVGLFDGSGNLKMVTVQEWYVRKFENGMTSRWSAYSDDLLLGDYFICSTSSEIKFQRKPNTPKGRW